DLHRRAISLLVVVHSIRQPLCSLGCVLQRLVVNDRSLKSQHRHRGEQYSENRDDHPFRCMSCHDRSFTSQENRTNIVCHLGWFVTRWLSELVIGEGPDLESGWIRESGPNVLPRSDRPPTEGKSFLSYQSPRVCLESRRRYYRTLDVWDDRSGQT